MYRFISKIKWVEPNEPGKYMLNLYGGGVFKEFHGDGRFASPNQSHVL